MKFILSLIAATFTMAAHADIEIPRSVGGDKGKYYLMSANRSGNIVYTLHKRVGPSGTGYTRVANDCATGQYTELGYSEVSPNSMTTYAPRWTDLVRGSSKSDLFNFVCTRY
jgi:hypothetical protein